MHYFSELISALNQTTKTNDKRDALVEYLTDAPDADKVWLVAIFTGRRPRRLVNTTLLKKWCMEETRLPEWLFQESYHTVGDLGEAITLMLPQTQAQRDFLLAELMEEIRKMQSAGEMEKKKFVLHQWRQLSKSACLVFNKVIIGGFRSGVSQNIVLQALAMHTSRDVQSVAHLISGNWDPYTISFNDLIHESLIVVDDSKPYPFYLAYAIEGAVESLGPPDEWQVEWKWDGIRGQLIRRNASLFLWSRGEDLITDRFPELEQFSLVIPEGTVLDGEVLSFAQGRPLPFQFLQTRISRKTLSKKQLKEAPVVFMVYDLLEHRGNDIRGLPMATRRQLLEEMISRVNHPHLLPSPVVTFGKWEELKSLIETSRERGCEGFMLKRRSSIYQAGRRKGDWWKWKIDPLTVDAVLVYAQKGHGKRSNLYTDYTFAVRNGDELVTFAKAYSGLTDKEIANVDRFVRQNSIEQFGPVRTVKPELVFEIAFEGIAASNRHKSGVAVRFPRILRQRTDKQVEDINTLEELQQLLAQYGK